MTYAIRKGRTIKIYDGQASPSVTIRCTSDDWLSRMNWLTSQIINNANVTGGKAMVDVLSIAQQADPV